jgi:hypothetical protein
MEPSNGAFIGAWKVGNPPTWAVVVVEVKLPQMHDDLLLFAMMNLYKTHW